MKKILGVVGSVALAALLTVGIAKAQSIVGPVYVATLFADAGTVSATQTIQPSTPYELQCNAEVCLKMATSGTVTPDCAKDFIIPPPATLTVVGTAAQQLISTRVFSGANVKIAVAVADAGTFGSDGGYATCNVFQDVYDRSPLTR